MPFREAHELVRDTSERIQLEWMFARSGFEELIVALLEIDRRRTRHVIQVVTFPIPRQRRTHRRAVTRVEKVVGPAVAHLLCENRGRIAKVWRVVVKKIAAVLARR